jgi:chemotaxis protein methyltransferase CheR
MSSPSSRDDRRLSLATFEAIRRALNAHAGLWFSPDMRPTVERRLRDRLRLAEVDSFEEYATRLDSDLAELEEAAEVCTVNETYAFRGAHQLRAFTEGILPRYAARDRITVWSAGCASGEEAYTLAALTLASGLVTPERVRIFGTDISRRCIALARRGVYSASSFRAEPGARSAFDPDRFFAPRPDGTRVVSGELKAICHFRHANLLDTAIGSFIDVVFCRNVLIHMDERSRRRIILGFFERLSPGGYLVLGHSESLLRSSIPFIIEELKDEIVYRKPELHEAGAE